MIALFGYLVVFPKGRYKKGMVKLQKFKLFMRISEVIEENLRERTFNKEFGEKFDLSQLWCSDSR